MASNYYRQHFAGGTSAIWKRSVKQGRPKADPETKAVPILITIDPASLRVIDANAKKAGMSRSAWLAMAGTLFSI